AYARLAGEGYLLTRGAAGTVVSPALRLPATPPSPGPAEASARRPSPDQPLPFQMGLPALDRFPRTLWARLAARAARRLGGGLLSYPDVAGLPALREAVAGYLAVSRGVACRPEQVIVTAGYQAALGMLARLLLRPGDTVWFEEPGYFLARRALQAAGARALPVPVDGDGIEVERARSDAPGARLAVVTPTHQAPLGVALSLPRRQALLDWAAAADAWVLEDDYDSEFHYDGHKLPALKSLDVADRVIYAGSFSKTLYPGLRLGYLVLPVALREAVTATLGDEQRGLPVLDQMVAADFMAEGHFARHLKRMRGLYAARRAALAQALADRFGARATIDPQAGGLHLIMRPADGGRDGAMVRRAAAEGLAPAALSGQYAGPARRHGLLLGFTNIAEERAAEAAAALARALG
ncbi:MAG TPA: PLP-dependent aminotransferase family protein, partial [Alphaproteobacteria bacterium]|nr:PLP-dependent aminotransferase family protein [Alphaproteobacteria bacterium]